MSDGPAESGATGGASAEPPWQVESDPLRDSPELFVGVAFLGGFALARILRKLGG